MKPEKIELMDKIIFWSLCEFVFVYCVSIAGANIGMGLASGLFVIRLLFKHDDVKDNFKKIYKAHGLIIKGIAFFWLSALLSTVFSGNMSAGIRTFANSYIYHMMPMMIIMGMLYDRKKLKTIAVCFIVSFTMNNLYAWSQFLRDYMVGMYDDGSIHMLRYSGSLNPIHYGGIIAGMIPVLTVGFIKLEEIKSRILIALPLLIATGTMLINGTRGAWIAVSVVTVIILAVTIKSRVKLVGIVAVTVIIVSAIGIHSPSLSDRAESIMDRGNASNAERYLLWESSWEMFKDYPALGVGIGRWGEKYHQEYISDKAQYQNLGHAHNNFMHILSERGSVGFIAYVFLLTCLFLTFIRAWRKGDKALSVALFGMWLSMTVQGLTEYNMGTAVTAKFYWLSIGLYVGYKNFEAQERGIL